MSAAIAALFEQQAKACDEMGSPLTARVMRACIATLDETTATGRRVLGWRPLPNDVVALRLAGALHSLALQRRDADLAGVYLPNSGGDVEEAVAAALKSHDEWICAWLDSPPQTNETGRSIVLLPGFLMIARETGMPLALREIGSSAGLNLFFDHFRYRYDDRDWGDLAFPATLAPQMRGAAPDLSGELKIASRAGSDIAPLDVHDKNDRLRLRSYIWADQSERLSRLDAALAVAQRGGFTLEQADAADFVARRLAARLVGQCFVLFHSVVWQYLPDATRQAIQTTMHNAGTVATLKAPLAWLRMETLSNTDPYPVLQLTLWPGGQTRTLALADFHGRWVEWN